MVEMMMTKSRSLAFPKQKENVKHPKGGEYAD